MCVHIQQCMVYLLSHRLVKLGSPYVNVMIVAGTVVFYAMVILFGVDENVASHSVVSGLCHTRIWLVSIGFSLLYGTIFAKTWRVHYIFNYIKPKSKLVSHQLFWFWLSCNLIHRKLKTFICLELLEYLC